MALSALTIISSLISILCAQKRTYTAKIDVTNNAYVMISTPCLSDSAVYTRFPNNILDPETKSRLHLRICNNAQCSTWQTIGNGLSSGSDGRTHTYSIDTPYDYGTMNKLQLSHTGDDQLCLDWVEIDGARWDWGTLNYCYESDSSNTNTCSTLTVTSANDWSTSDTNPCEYISEFYATYTPTP